MSHEVERLWRWRAELNGGAQCKVSKVCSTKMSQLSRVQKWTDPAFLNNFFFYAVGCKWWTICFTYCRNVIYRARISPLMLKVFSLCCYVLLWISRVWCRHRSVEVDTSHLKIEMLCSPKSHTPWSRNALGFVAALPCLPTGDFRLQEGFHRTCALVSCLLLAIFVTKS
jgi:hypothetical protein